MPLTLQTRLLRVLQERRITRLGSITSIPVDVRVIAATHQPLLQLVSTRHFRQDLYYRLNTLTLGLPALRDRGGDVRALAEHLLSQSLSRVGVSGIAVVQVLSQLGEAMMQHQWPGNVRELENMCDRIAVYLHQYNRIETVEWGELRYECPELFSAHLQLDQAPGKDAPQPDRNALALAALERHGGRPGAAAAELGISRSTFWRWCRTSEHPAAERLQVQD